MRALTPALLSTTLITAMLLPAGLLAAPARVAATAPEAIFVAGGQYTATLEQTQNRWRFLPMNGQDVVVGDVGHLSMLFSPTVLSLVAERLRDRPAVAA